MALGPRKPQPTNGQSLRLSSLAARRCELALTNTLNWETSVRTTDF